MPYTAPTIEQRFVLDVIAALPGLAALPDYANATPDMIDAILGESAKLASNVFAPLNRVGDKEHARLNDGNVTLPAGFAGAYAQYVEGGWAGLGVAEAHGGQGLPFAVAVADVGDAAQAASVLALWQELTLANMKAAPDSRQLIAQKIPGASAALPVVRLQAQGQRADGAAVSGQAAYFAQGSQVFQVVMYAPKIAPDVAETFFSSLKFE